MAYEIITGMSLDYYNNIGKYMIESWLKFWPKDFILNVYTENILPINNNRINVVDINNIDDKYVEFQNANFKLADRAKRFAKKAWPIMKHLKKNDGHLIWIDADVITIDTITVDWLNSLINKNQFSAHIGVQQGKYYSVETGFFIINRSHHFKNNFLNEYCRIYHERDFSNQHKPFDGDVFGKVIRHLRSEPEFFYRELNKNYETVLSPFNGIFDGKMQHYKAKRKNNFKLQ